METEIRETEGKSTWNISLQLPQPYQFLARHTDTSFTKVFLHCLFLSKPNRASLSLSRIVKILQHR
jgi:large subunit ribosomal protein L18e